MTNWLTGALGKDAAGMSFGEMAGMGKAAGVFGGTPHGADMAMNMGLSAAGPVNLNMPDMGGLMSMTQNAAGKQPQQQTVRFESPYGREGLMGMGMPTNPWAQNPWMQDQTGLMIY
jgi:hypothetical protein